MNIREIVEVVDKKIINTCIRCNGIFARVALFVVFFWFGILKVVTESPANPLVDSLLQRTLPFFTFEEFIVWFGLFEVLIGIIFLIPKWERFALLLLAVHMITTFGPIVMLPEMVWSAPFVPTLEGQYIVKNLIIIALAIGIVANLRPMTHSHRLEEAEGPETAA
ncbi:MAG: hypothetical protein WD200_00705 [Candidatus Andersenbacteria bacterium]